MKLGIYVGPVAVKQIAEDMRSAGLNVICQGTETIWINLDGVQGDAFDHYLAVVRTMRGKLNRDYGITWRDVRF